MVIVLPDLSIKGSTLKTSYTNEIETNAIFLGVDDSILKMNPLIASLGFEFVFYSASDLEKGFSKLFNLPENFKATGSLRFEKIGGTVSQEFYDNFNAQPYIPFGAKGLFILRKTTTHQQEIKDGSLVQLDMTSLNHTQDFADDLIRRLRLFKNGDISVPIIFEINIASRHVGARTSQITYLNRPITTYSINDDDINNLKTHLLEPYIPNLLTELAETYFHESYLLNNSREKVVNLVTALEALFNRGPSQISHIIARHLSLIISSDKEELLNNYSKIKKLYNLRSKIVHGQASKPSEDMKKSVLELQELVRKAILYCLRSGKDKEQLFDYLNCKGFEK